MYQVILCGIYVTIFSYIACFVIKILSLELMHICSLSKKDVLFSFSSCRSASENTMVHFYLFVFFLFLSTLFQISLWIDATLFHTNISLLDNYPSFKISNLYLTLYICLAYINLLCADFFFLSCLF